MMGLTKIQTRALGVIRQYIAETGVAPTVQELTNALGLSSKSGAHRILTGLEKRGAIRRIPAQHRAIEIVETARGDDLSAFARRLATASDAELRQLRDLCDQILRRRSS